MDADFSHDPADLPRLLAAVRDGADLAIGSRYVAGGAIEGWSTHRRLLSRAGSRYAQRVLGVGVHDLTGGMKCFRAGVLEAIALDTLQASGYAFQVETTYRVLRLGMAVTEVPIVFRERTLGRSKMSLRIAAEAVWRIPRLRERSAAPAAFPVHAA
jgi:dolichol-phosphate mannosyltransferase